MLQSSSDFIFEQPMIYFGSFYPLSNEENESDDATEFLDFFNLRIISKPPLQQEIGLYFRWPDF